jgi:hypothetical protein
MKTKMKTIDEFEAEIVRRTMAALPNYVYNRAVELHSRRKGVYHNGCSCSYCEARRLGGREVNFTTPRQKPEAIRQVRSNLKELKKIPVVISQTSTGSSAIVHITSWIQTQDK